MQNQTKTGYVHQAYWQRIVLDLAWVSIAFISTYVISSYFNFSDNYYVWTQQYEDNLDIDELLPAMLVALVALLWFAHRRIKESRILIKKNHALLQRILEVQEDERKRIARDLHDDLGQYLTAINAQASSLQIATVNRKETQLISQRITANANHAYQATHHLIRALRPVALDELGLSAAIEHLVNTSQSQKSIAKDIKNQQRAYQIQYQLQIDGDINQYDENINIAIYRIIQEALTNILKHAQAHIVSIHIKSMPKHLEIEINDDGIGFDISKQHSGYGLQGMAERVEALGGILEISSQKDSGLSNKNPIMRGTKIHIQIKVVRNE